MLSVRCFNRLRLWWNCASWIDDNMYWAPIDLFCDTLFVYKTIEFSAVALAWLATSALKKLHAILCLKETLGFDWVWFFGDLNLRIFFTLLSVRCFNWLRLWWNCASWIDNMHWAPIYLFYDTLFVYKTIEIFAFALASLATSALKRLYAILCLKETLEFDWIWFFGDLKIRIFFTLLSVRCFNWLRFWWDCASWIDDNMHWALIDLFCDTLFVYKTWVFRGCSRLACYFCFEKVICNFVPQGNAWPWLSLIFWRPKTSHFLHFDVCSVFQSIVMRLCFLNWW